MAFNELIFASIFAWVYLCRHLFERLPLFKLQSIRTGLMISLINFCSSVNTPTTIGGKKLKNSQSFFSYEYPRLISVRAIADRIFMYVKQSKAGFLFKSSSTSFLVCISWDHSCQIWKRKLNEQPNYTVPFLMVNIKRSLCLYFNIQDILLLRLITATIPVAISMSSIKYENVVDCSLIFLL